MIHIKVLVVFLIYFSGIGLAQTLPVGTPVLEDFVRRQQLLGLSSSTMHPSSLLLRPLFFQENQNDKIIVRAMPLIWKQQFNSNHPEGTNNGSMIPARGYQTLLSGGFFAKYGIISVQLMPEFVFAQNQNFDGLSTDLPKKVWNVYNLVKRRIDLPDRFGDETYSKFFWGQSNARLTYRSLSVGISNENLWWGPGIKNTLLMTNNAPGFKHVTFNTVKPIITPIGNFEWQIIGGKLENSKYPGIDSLSLAFHGLKPNKRKKDSWRYINAMIVNYQPKWLPGLNIGGVRSYTLYSDKLTNNYRTFLPLFEPLFKLDVGGEVADTIQSDQIASVYARWVMPESHSEIYAEYGRTDHSWDITDFILEPGHYRAYILGYRKLVPFLNKKNEYIDIQLETTQLGRNLSSSLRKINTPAVWYTHGYVLHGYTNNGQILGSGIGTSSNMQSLNISWVKDYKSIGIEFHRLAHDEDFWAYITQTTGYGDYRTHWVDVGAAVVADWDFKNLLVNFKLQTIGSINYMFHYDPIPSDPPFWWDKGKVRYNVHAELSLVYLLKN
jgi:hypothetical protein